MDRSKNVALVPPGFGTPTSSSQVPYHLLHPADEAHLFHCSSSSNCNHYVGLQLDSFLPGSVEALTPNLVPEALNGGLVNQVGSVNYPAIDSGAQTPSSGNITMTQIPGAPSSIVQGGTAATSDNRLTLYTCVRDERDSRWKVTALEQ